MQTVELTPLHQGRDPWLDQPASGIKAIDTHAHVFVQGLPLVQQRRHAPDYDATMDDYAVHLQANEISHAVLVQPSFLGTDNSYFLNVAQRYPDRLRGVAVVDCNTTATELAALDRAGVVGMRLNLIGLPLPDLTSPEWRSLLARVNDLGWHVEIHRLAQDLPAVLEPLLQQNCTVVVDHFGRPDPRLGTEDPGFRYLLSLGSCGRVWVKLSAAYRSASESDGSMEATPLAQHLLSAYTPARLVWGSDWPHTQHQHLIDYAASRHALDLWVPDPDQRNTILIDSARRLYRI